MENQMIMTTIINNDTLLFFKNFTDLIFSNHKYILSSSILFVFFIIFFPSLWDRVKYFFEGVLNIIKTFFDSLWKIIQFLVKSCYMFICWSSVEEDHERKIDELREENRRKIDELIDEFKDFKLKTSKVIEDLTNRVLEAEKKVFEQGIIINSKDVLLVQKESEIKKLKSKKQNII